MNKLISHFLDRVVERVTVLVTGVVSSRVEGLQAVVQAEQQSELEDLARQYEAEGKLEVAQTLRQRAGRLTCNNLAGEADDMMRQVTAPLAGLPNQEPEATLPALPDKSSGSGKRRSTKSARSSNKSGSEDPLGDIH